MPSASPTSAAKCKRRTGVRAGMPGRSATTRGTTPLRNTSSTSQRISSARFGVINVNRPGLMKEIIPSACRRSVLHSGEIQKIGPSVFLAIIIARLRRLGPQASCTRPKVKWMPCHSSSVDMRGGCLRSKRFEVGSTILIG